MKDNFKPCHIRHKKVRLCTCSRCGGSGYVTDNRAIVVCPLCLGGGYMKKSEKEASDASEE